MSLLRRLAGVPNASGVIDSMNGTLGKIDSMTTSEEEKSSLRKTVTLALVEAQQAVLIAEIQGGTWLARSWRPVLMLTFGFAIFHNYVVGPTFGWGVVEIPEDMWSFLKWGVGGYIGGRSIEKVAQTVSPVYSARQLRKLKKAGIEVDDAK